MTTTGWPYPSASQIRPTASVSVIPFAILLMVMNVAGATTETFRIADIRAALPGISDPTIRLTLETLKTQGLITVDGTGRSATWRRLRPEH
jgi:hypothetical protein